MTFMVACSKFFRRHPGQSLVQFAEELKALTPEDRAELTPMLAEALGEEVG